MPLRHLALIALCLALPGSGIHAQATHPATGPFKPFTATYQVLRGGSAVGTSTLSLRHDADGSWTYTSKLQADTGLAAMLGASVQEESHFRLRGGRPEMLTYDYAMHVAFKDKSRKVRADWSAGTVKVTTGKGNQYSYKTRPGLVERHLLVLALGQAAAAGRHTVALPVAVKDRVEQQTFTARPKQQVEVPAGTFQALRYDRTHDDKGWSAWFVPTRFGAVPVKVAQQAGGDITLLLRAVQRP